MKVVIQRVSKAAVSIQGNPYSQINQGLLLLLGIADTDTISDVEWLCNKIINLRIFNDPHGVMNLSVNHLKYDILLISQFTLQAQTQKGHRPSYIKAAKPEIALPLYKNCIKTLNELLGKPIFTGVFGADMQVQLINDGPVTIILDSQQKTT